MNIRNKYDQKLERIIEEYESQLSPHQLPTKHSYLDFNYPGMRPILPQFLTGFNRVIAQYQQDTRRKIKALDEEECLQLLQQRAFPDIHKIKTMEEDYDRIDWYVPSHNIHIEHKKRNRPYFDQGLTIDRGKYDILMQEENPYYINSSSIGLFIWNLKLIGECEWEYTDKSPKSNSGPRATQLESNYITYLPYEKCNDLTYLLL